MKQHDGLLPQPASGRKELLPCLCLTMMANKSYRARWKLC